MAPLATKADIEYGLLSCKWFELSVLRYGGFAAFSGQPAIPSGGLLRPCSEGSGWTAETVWTNSREIWRCSMPRVQQISRL